MFKHFKPSVNLLCLLIVLSVTALTIVLYSCNNNPAKESLEDEIADGKELARKYCTPCHQLPDPSQLDRKTWERSVLPAMASRLRLHSYVGQIYADRESFITVPDWQKIVTYFKNTAPDSLIIPKHALEPLIDWSIFKPVRPAKVDTAGLPAMTTFVGYNPKDQKIYSADASNNLLTWDNNLNFKLVKKMASPVTGAMFFKDNANVNTGIFTCIGILPPKDGEKGEVIQCSLDGNAKDSVVIADGLPRPIQTVAADFNKDGLIDYVVCGFGHEKGGLYLLQQQPDHRFKKAVIKDAPGGEQLITGDFNNDGWPDVMCLFAQADEGSGS